MKNISACVALISVLLLSSCSFDLQKLNEDNQNSLREKKEAVMEEMEAQLSEKYSDILGNDPDEIVFDVYDLTKGENQAWFNDGVYPATAVYEANDEEFTVQIEITDRALEFGDMEDSFYGVLYGEDVKDELYNLAESYGITEINIYYEPDEDIITDEDELREHLTIFGHYNIENSDDLDTVCDMVDEFRDFGCNNNIYVDAADLYDKSTRIGDRTSDELREFFTE